MNRLATLLGKSDAEVRRMIEQLEAKTGYESTDVRFLAAHQQAVRAKIGELGLDADDTTGEELYHALLAKFERDAQLVEKALGLEPEADANAKYEKARNLLQVLLKDAEAWSLKSSALKDLVRQNPPKKAMKLLGYRSVESLLKHEDTGKILLAARGAESPAWRRKIETAAAKFGTSAHEMRRLKIIDLEPSTDFLNSEVAAYEPLSGTLAIAKNHLQPNGAVLTLLLAAITQIERASGTRGLGDSLAKLNPALAWWDGVEHMAALKDGAAVSLNVRDVARNYSQKLNYQQRMSSHAASSIWNRLTEAYEQKLQSFSTETSALETEAAETVHKLRLPIRQLAAEVVEV